MVVFDGLDKASQVGYTGLRLCERYLMVAVFGTLPLLASGTKRREAAIEGIFGVGTRLKLPKYIRIKVSGTFARPKTHWT